MTVVRLPLLLCFVGWISIQNINATYYEHWSTSPSAASEIDIVLTDIPSSYDTYPAFSASDIPVLDNPISKARRYIPRKSTSKRYSHCAANEIFKRCQPKCARKTCADYRIPTRCSHKDRGVCVSGCICRSRYYRNANGVCVPREECLICNRGDEVFKCGPSSQETCDGESHPLQDPSHCEKGCYCRDGYVRNNRGFCIPKEDCPKNIKCTGNKIYRNCGYAVPKTCENIGDPDFECSAEEYDCRPGCYCKVGFVENSDGDCVQPSDCYQCKKNEVYKDCRQQCPAQKCGVNPEVIRCAAPKPENCKAGCDCIDNYVRDDNGICIPRDQCPENQCKKNEVYKDCRQQCPAQKCGINPEVIRCPAPKQENCKAGCDCIDNYVRDVNGICIPRDQCPEKKIECTGNKIYVKCGYACPITCENIADPDFECSAEEDDCRPGCYCKEGFVENSGGECVRPSDCFTDQCMENEVYKDCRQQCPVQKCGINPEVIRCAAPKPENCKAGCDCIDNYVRDVNGICIPRDQCPETNKGCNGDPNAETGCDTCNTSCSNYAVKPKRCNRRACRIDECKCKDGFVKNNKELCIPYHDCPKNEGCKGDRNAEIGCDLYVKTCSNYHMKRERYHEQICDNQSDGCKCKDGFIKDKRGLCIHPKDCSPQCAVNEVWSECPDICKLETCNVLIHDYTCSPIQPKICSPRCVCAEGFYRNDDRICVEASKCFETPPKSVT